MKNENNTVETETSTIKQIASDLKLLQSDMTELKEHEIKSAPYTQEMPLYASVSRMSKLYSMSRDKLERILKIPVKEGKIRVLRPTDNTGRIGNKSYNLIDFEKHFAHPLP